MKATAEIEMLIKSTQARELLGLGTSMFSAVKSAMGIKNRKRVVLSDIKRWLRDNAGFREQDVYHRPACACEKCLIKRRDPLYRPRGRGAKKSDQRVGAVL